MLLGHDFGFLLSTGFNQSFTTYTALSKYEGNGLVINKNDNIEVFDDSENGKCLLLLKIESLLLCTMGKWQLCHLITWFKVFRFFGRNGCENLFSKSCVRLDRFHFFFSADWWYVADTKGTKGWAPADFFSLSTQTVESSSVPLKEEIDLLQLNTSGWYHLEIQLQCSVTFDTIMVLLADDIVLAELCWLFSLHYIIT